MKNSLAQVDSSPVYFIDDKFAISLEFDNDTYYYTDYNYTYGLELEFTAPFLNTSPFRHVFPKATDNQINISGVSLVQRLYSPQDIHDTAIQFNDRPFAATLELTHFLYSRNAHSGLEFSSRLRLGVMGPAAGGAKLQQKIHDWIKSPDPLGWDYQISNYLIINYDFYIFYPILYRPDYKFGISGRARAGTLFDDFGAGINFAFGKKQFGQEKLKSRKFRFGFNTDAALRTVLYNATLQGGMFSNDNPYTIGRDEISPFVFSFNASIFIAYQAVCLSLEHNFLTKEFKSGISHAYSSIKLGLAF
jgi:hypothetical protein